MPAIRFPGFTDSWEQRKFGDIADSYSGGTPTAGKKEFYDGDIPFIRSGEISSDKTELFLSEDGLNNSSAKMVKKGDILYALYGATSGEVSISKLNGAINQAILAIKPYLNYDSQFLMQWLRKSKETIIGTYLQGGQGNLSGNIVKDLLIDMPAYNEQKQIGSYYEQLDYLITLQERKCRVLRELKKCMLQKMFPKNGSDIPEIRFPGFTDSWEQRKLGDIVERVVRKNTNNESSLPLTISAQYGLVDQITYFNNRVASRDVSNYYLVLNGEFAYNKSTSDGFPFGAIKRLDLYEKGVLSTLYIVFSIKNQSEIDSDYLTVFFDTDRWHKGVSERAAEGARNHGLLNISADDFFDIDIFLPRHKEEQVAIGSYLRHLDHLITLQERKCKVLRELKKCMLQKMFV